MKQNKAPIQPKVFQGDLSPDQLKLYLEDDRLAVDCEMMGLNPRRDRLCVVQLCDSRNNGSLVQVLPGQTEAPLMKKLLESKDVLKIFHFARMDMSFLKARLGIDVNTVYCTKIASKLARTYTDKHGLKELIREFFDENLDKKNQSSDWGKKQLTKDQLEYAMSDVKFLISLQHLLEEMLHREGRYKLALECFQTLPTIVTLDLLEIHHIFEH
jgi:ribonuclease D